MFIEDSILINLVDFYRLDQILGKQGSKSKDVYASKISLASRVVKIERQVWLRITLLLIIFQVFEY